jgi:hypothetical protein
MERRAASPSVTATAREEADTAIREQPVTLSGADWTVFYDALTNRRRAQRGFAQGLRQIRDSTRRLAVRTP